jgi:hypothetical protein
MGSAVVLAELERVGDGLERLASLVRLAREPEALRFRSVIRESRLGGRRRLFPSMCGAPCRRRHLVLAAVFC